MRPMPGSWASRGVIAPVYTLRREPLYHKLQYSKVPKFDAAAAALGVILGAFVVYLGLSSLGSAGADLGDLTALCWYVALWLTSVRVAISLMRGCALGSRTIRFLPLVYLFEVAGSMYRELIVLWHFFGLHRD
jgi:hypothetical protein